MSFTYNVAVRPKFKCQSAFSVLDLLNTLEEGKVAVDPLVVDTCDGGLDLFDDVKNSFVGYTAWFVSQLRQI